MSDYISKAEAIEWLKEAKSAGCINKYSNAIRRDHFDEAIETIESIPIVDAEPVRRGRWIYGQEVCREYIGLLPILVQYEHWECSMCRYRTDKKPLWNYCPNCGARMDGEV